MLWSGVLFPMLHFVSDLQKSQVTKSLRSPHGVPKDYGSPQGIHKESSRSPGSLPGVPKESPRSPQGLWESPRSPWGLPSNVWGSVTYRSFENPTLTVGSKMIRLWCLYGQKTTQNTTNNILKCEVWVNPSLQSSREWWRVMMVRNDAIVKSR